MNNEDHHFRNLKYYFQSRTTLIVSDVSSSEAHEEEPCHEVVFSEPINLTTSWIALKKIIYHAPLPDKIIFQIVKDDFRTKIVEWFIP